MRVILCGREARVVHGSQSRALDAIDEPVSALEKPRAVRGGVCAGCTACVEVQADVVDGRHLGTNTSQLPQRDVRLPLRTPPFTLTIAIATHKYRACGYTDNDQLYTAGCIYMMCEKRIIMYVEDRCTIVVRNARHTCLSGPYMWLVVFKNGPTHDGDAPPMPMK